MQTSRCQTHFWSISEHWIILVVHMNSCCSFLTFFMVGAFKQSHGMSSVVTFYLTANNIQQLDGTRCLLTTLCWKVPHSLFVRPSPWWGVPSIAESVTLSRVHTTSWRETGLGKDQHVQHGERILLAEELRGMSTLTEALTNTVSQLRAQSLTLGCTNKLDLNDLLHINAFLLFLGCFGFDSVQYNIRNIA